MLGVSRVGYSLATNRQIPSAAGRLSIRWGTPVVVIALASMAAAALVLPRDLELLIGIYAFGALVAFTIAHVSVIVLRFREPAAPRAYAVPLSVPVARRAGARCRRCSAPRFRRRADLGAHLPQRRAISSASAGCSSGWRCTSTYRRTQGKPVFKRVTIPERALRREAPERRVRFDPGADLRHRARRRHRPDGRPAGRRDPRRRRGGGGGDRGDLVLRDARCRCRSTRRCPMPRSQRARAGAGARQGGGGGVRGGAGGDRDRPRRRRRARRSSTRRGGGGSRRSCSPPRSPRGSAAAGCSAALAAGELRRGVDQVRHRQGARAG